MPIYEMCCTVCEYTEEMMMSVKKYEEEIHYCPQCLKQDVQVGMQQKMGGPALMFTEFLHGRDDGQ